MTGTVTLDDVRAAYGSFRGQVRRTPMLPSSALSVICGADVWLKAENLQHTGSFKTRGAMHRLAALTPQERQRGVIAASAGNHAQGVAVAAQAHGIAATIVMPANAPLAKVAATRDYGAAVVLHGDSYVAAYDEAARLGRERGLMLISAYDDPLIVAGQGTVGIEMIEDLTDAGTIVVPVGGGGLAAGIGVAVKAMSPRTRVIGVQAEAAPGVTRSLASGAIERMDAAPTIADGIAVAGPGEVTFPLLQQHLDGIVTVSEDDIAQAMVLLLERSKLVVEGAGAVGVAALTSGRIDARGATVAVVVSGGNVDINMLARVVEHGLMQAGRYYSLTVGVDDKPGQLALLAEVLSAAGANVLSVSHHRFGIALPVGRVQVVLLLEVRDREHGLALERALEEAGFARGGDGQPQFVPAEWLRR